MQITRNTLETAAGPAEWFTGSVFIDSIAAPPDGSFGAAAVHFTPGARTAWHTHPLGQTIWVTAGVRPLPARGRADRGDPPRRPRLLRAGREALARRRADRLHDAHRDSAGGREGSVVTWGEHVTDEQYGQAPTTRRDHLMRATIMYGAGDVRVENVPDPRSRADRRDPPRGPRLHLRQRPVAVQRHAEERDGAEHGPRGHRRRRSRRQRRPHVKPGQVVVMPFAISDGTCEFCQEGLPTACVHVGFVGNRGMNGAQAEALRIPFADGTLYPTRRQRERRAHAVAAHALRRDGHRPPRGGRRARRARATASRSSATAPSACAA